MTTEGVGPPIMHRWLFNLSVCTVNGNYVDMEWSCTRWHLKSTQRYPTSLSNVLSKLTLFTQRKIHAFYFVAYFILGPQSKRVTLPGCIH